MLDVVGYRVDDAGNQRLSVRQLHFLPNFPFMLVTRVSGFHVDERRVDLQDRLDDLTPLNVQMMRAGVIPPADMQSYLVRWQTPYRMVHRLDRRRHIFLYVTRLIVSD